MRTRSGKRPTDVLQKSPRKRTRRGTKAEAVLPPSGCERHRVAPETPTPCPFRLFTIDGWSLDGRLEITILEGQSSHDVNGYQAISYAWMGQHRDTSIDSNGQELRITKSLYIFLATLKILEMDQTPRERTYYWADQICILQNQTSDKERQIPVMDTYFSQANAVLIWLGKPTTLTKPTFEMLEDVCAKLVDTEKVDCLWRRGCLPSDLPEPGHFFWRGLGEILTRPWFSRLWTLQEIGLAKRAIFYCGSRTADLSVLFDRLFRAGMMQLIDGPGFHPDDISNFSRLLYTIQFYRNGIPSGPLISIARRRQCEKDSDKVYALLGLASSEDRELVKVGYSEEEVDSYIETWIHWAHLALQREGLSLLVREGWNRIPELPSWCPNLKSPAVTGCVRLWDHERGDDIPCPYAVTADKKGLICHGCAVEKVKKVVERPDAEDLEAQLQLCRDQIAGDWPSFDGEMKDSLTSQAWFISRCWALGQEVAGDPNEKWVEFLRTITIGEILELKDKDIPDEDSVLRQKWVELEIGKSTNGLKELEIQSVIRRACKGRNFFITEKGMMGLGPLDVQAGDLVYTFRAVTSPLLILREIERQDDIELIQLDPEKGNTGCIFLGDAYVHGLMGREVEEMLRQERGLKEQFFTIY